MIAPVIVFTYNRLEQTQNTLEALEKNFLSSESELFIFSDGPKNEDSIIKVKEVREYLNTVKGFKKVTIYYSDHNKGLANSIISGVTQIINHYNKVIVLEDDLITSKNFLDFMNQALDYYECNSQIHSISGYTLELPSLRNYSKDFYFGYRASSWGWGTWKDKWNVTDWDVKDYNIFRRNLLAKKEFMRGGIDMPRMLNNQMKGKIDSWAIRWCFNQFLKNEYTVFPSISKVQNIGIGETATHTKKTKRFSTMLDISENRVFNFENDIIFNNSLLREFKAKFGILARLKDKLL